MSGSRSTCTSTAWSGVSKSMLLSFAPHLSVLLPSSRHLISGWSHWQSISLVRVRAIPFSFSLSLSLSPFLSTDLLFRWLYFLLLLILFLSCLQYIRIVVGYTGIPSCQYISQWQIPRIATILRFNYN